MRFYTIIIICFYATLGISTFYYFQPFSKKTFSQNIYTINTIFIFRSNFNNSSNNYLKCPPKFLFLPFFLFGIIQFQLKIFFTNVVFIWLDNLFPKYFALLAKIFNLLVNLVFEICLGRKFPLQGEILKKCLP